MVAGLSLTHFGTKLSLVNMFSPLKYLFISEYNNYKAWVLVQSALYPDT